MLGVRGVEGFEEWEGKESESQSANGENLSGCEMENGAGV